MIDLEKLEVVETIEHLKIYFQDHDSYLIVSDKSPMFCIEAKSINDAKDVAIRVYISYVELTKNLNVP